MSVFLEQGTPSLSLYVVDFLYLLFFFVVFNSEIVSTAKGVQLLITFCFSITSCSLSISNKIHTYMYVVFSSVVVFLRWCEFICALYYISVFVFVFVFLFLICFSFCLHCLLLLFCLFFFFSVLLLFISRLVGIGA